MLLIKALLKCPGGKGPINGHSAHKLSQHQVEGRLQMQKEDSMRLFALTHVVMKKVQADRERIAGGSPPQTPPCRGNTPLIKE